MTAIRVYTASGGWQDIALVGPQGPQGIQGIQGVKGDTGQVGTVPTRVTSLPGSPVDGQECYYVADATNGVLWHLKYNAGSASPYKWEFVGGPPLRAAIVTTETFNGTTNVFSDLATPGPSVTLPLAGDYDVLYSAESKLGASNQTNFIGINNQLTPVTPPSGLFWAKNYANILVYLTITGEARYTGCASGSPLRMVYSGTNASAVFTSRYMTVKPVRVG